MRIFPLPTVPVDNFVENLMRGGSNARPAGLQELFPFPGQFEKSNEIKTFFKTPHAYLSVALKFVGKAFMCISQVLTGIFLLYPTANARRYWTASAIWLPIGTSVPARSAIARATFSTR
jgi:hypothetical protein